MTQNDLNTLIEQEYPRLVGALGLFTGSRDVAEELAQEALVRMWLRGRSDDLNDVRAWLHRVAFNLARSWFRTLQAERRAKDRALGFTREFEPVDLTEVLAIREALGRLPKRQRLALVLRYYSDLPFREIAGVMDLPEPTARSLVRRALITLRKSEDLGQLKEVLDA